MVVEAGDKVKIDYILQVDGKVFDTSIEDVAKGGDAYKFEKSYEPIVIEVGSSNVIKGLNNGLLGMSIGEEKEIIVTPVEGYGYRDENKVQTLPRKLLESSGVDLSPGTRIKIRTQAGEMIAVVTGLTENDVTFDLNPDLCDKTLTFNIVLKEVLQ